VLDKAAGRSGTAGADEDVDAGAGANEEAGGKAGAEPRSHGFGGDAIAVLDAVGVGKMESPAPSGDCRSAIYLYLTDCTNIPTF
jgi:hypothetical protein